MVSHQKVVDLPPEQQRLYPVSHADAGSAGGEQHVHAGGGSRVIINGMRPSKTAFLIGVERDKPVGRRSGYAAGAGRD